MKPYRRKVIGEIGGRDWKRQIIPKGDVSNDIAHQSNFVRFLSLVLWTAHCLPVMMNWTSPSSHNSFDYSA